MSRIIPLLVLIIVVAGCSSVRRTASGETIYLKGTTDYQQKVAGLKLSVDQAKERLAAYLDQTKGQPATRLGHMLGMHQTIVGDAFVFTFPSMTKEVSLSGYYVDGNTGKVSERRENPIVAR